MASKSFYHDIDLNKVGQLQNARIHNLSDSEVSQLAATLTADNVGLVVYNTTTKSLATWNGTGFDAYQIDVVGDIKFAGAINPTNSATIAAVPGAQYIVDTAGELDTQSGTISYSPSASVEVGDSVIFTTATTAFVIQRNVNQATDEALGTVRLATQADVSTGSVADEAVTPATLHGYVNPILTAETAARQAADAALQVTVDQLVAKRVDSRTIQSSDITVYADSSIPPMIDPTGRSGWYFKNASAGQKINWYPYANATGADASTFGSIVSIWAVVRFHTETSRPFITIYSRPTGSGDAASWYKSRWGFELPQTPVVPTPVGTYLVHFGADPGVHQHLPRLALPDVVGISHRGTRDINEQLAMYAWGTNSSAAANSQEITIEQTGHNFGGRLTEYSYVHTGASQAEVATLNTTLTAVDSVLSARAAALEARDELFTHFDTVSLSAGIPLTVTHGLGLADKDAFTINTMHNGNQVSLAVASVDANSLTLESAVSVSDVKVSIIGF